MPELGDEDYQRECYELLKSTFSNQLPVMCMLVEEMGPEGAYNVFAEKILRDEPRSILYNAFHYIKCSK